MHLHHTSVLHNRGTCSLTQAHSLARKPALNVSKNRHRPDLAGKTLAPETDAMISRAVHKVCEKGWETQIPYTNLTDAACHSEYLVMRGKEQVVRIGAGGMAMTTAPDLLANDPAKALLSFPKYLQAVRRHSMLISKYQPENKKYWDAHIDIICNHPRRDTHWSLVLQYDIEIHKRSCNGSINPGVFQENIFNHVMDNAWDKALEMVTNALRAAPQKSFQSHGTALVYGQPSSSRQTHPAPSQSNQKPAQGLSTLPPAPTKQRGKCFHCGNSSHSVKPCDQDTLLNKWPVFITRNQQNEWTINGSTFCYRFNSLSRCDLASCKYPPHICTLCRATDHGAQSCCA
jgi:hypothetical protein